MLISGTDTFFSVAFFLFGLIFGSFLNVCIYRMPRELSVVKPRSACPSCGKPIAAYDNIPVVSWLLLGGKCRHCKTPISPRYAAVELLTGGFFVLAYLGTSGRLPGFVVSTCDLTGRAITEPIRYCVLVFLLIGLIFTDAETKLLPDLLTKPGIALGLVLSLFAPVECGEQCGFSLLPSLANLVTTRGPLYSLVNSAAGAVVGSAFILGIALLYEAIRGVEGMGRGDVKLMALIGAFLGVKLTVLVLVLASAIGSIFGVLLILFVWRKRWARRRRRNSSEPAGESRRRAWQSAILVYRNLEIPFGVFLGMAALFSAFWGTWLLCVYLRASRLI